MKGDRVPAKVSGEIRLSPRMAKIAEFCAKKQESIDTTFETKAAKIRDAYVARLQEAVTKATTGGDKKTAAALSDRISKAADLDAWLEMIAASPDSVKSD